jgi:hypothetical protein
MELSDWATRWHIPPAALADLQTTLLGLDTQPGATTSMSEAGVQARVRLAASRRGMRVWRNNVGAVHDAELGRHVRYGLANDSSQVNAVLKSADLIGIRPRVIQPGDVGSLIGQFVSYECKHAGWKHRPNDLHEKAQANWAALVLSLGGDARFISHEGQI